ncbi:MAG: NAD(P)H-hydrate dehydratase [bacterium]|nr:NAD(P)H-hydrate dehydratase [bacterium]
MHVLTRAEMQAADSAAASVVSGGERALMANAGAALAEVCAAYAPAGAHIVCFAGRGNNGGDGALALAELSETHHCSLYLIAERDELGPSARIAVEHAAERGVAVAQLSSHPGALLAGADLAVEAIVGTGSRLPLSPQMTSVVAALNAFDGPVIACDIPAGIDADSGAVPEVALKARATLALGAMKRGLLVEPGRSHAGELWIAEIGFPERLLDTYELTWRAWELATFARALPQREPRADKYAAGHVMIVAGSGDFPGAAVLCARAAARAGAGYVTLFTPPEAVAAARAHLVEQIVRPLPEDAEELLRALRPASAVAIGPGLGRAPETQSLVRALCAVERPLVVDADAISALTGHLELLAGKMAVITPHAGEFARLVERRRDEIESDPSAAARTFAAAHPKGPALVLKGSPTILTCDGFAARLGWAGTNALASAGTGDVLTGVIAALMARGLTAYEAAEVSVFWHALAGRVAESHHPGGVLAMDVCEALPAVVALARATLEAHGRHALARRVLPRL